MQPKSNNITKNYSVLCVMDLDICILNTNKMLNMKAKTKFVIEVDTIIVIVNILLSKVIRWSFVS